MGEDEKTEEVVLSSSDLKERIQELSGNRTTLRDKLDEARAAAKQLETALIGTEHRIAELVKLRSDLDEKAKAQRKKDKKGK
jgi:phage shock protein A